MLNANTERFSCNIYQKHADLIWIWTLLLCHELTLSLAQLSHTLLSDFFKGVLGPHAKIYSQSVRNSNPRK